MADRSAPDAAARALSLVLSPYVVTAVTATAVTFSFGRPGPLGLLQLLVGVTASAVVPLVFTLWMVRTGRITDIHAAVRGQRHSIFVVAIASTALSTVFMHLTGAAPIVIGMGVAYCLSGAVFWAVTAFWKISLHTGVLAGSLVIAAYAFGDPALLASPLVPLLAWARVRRGRHTLAQVGIGALCGAVITGLVLRRWVS